MLNGYKIICEAMQLVNVPFIVHEHEPRRGSKHYDVRFLDPRDPKILHSFAAPSNFPDTAQGKTVLAKTRDHDPRWLKLKSYRLKTVDEGKAEIKMATHKYFEITFNGKLLNGFYKLFKMSNTQRDDRWLLIKSKEKT